jgi:hypothetical protein
MFVCPSRSRPHNVARLVDACRATGATAAFLVCIDDDDPLREAYEAQRLPEGWTIRAAPRDGLSAIYNAAFRASPACDFYGVVADDIVPETNGWDRALIEAAGTDGIAWGDDGINGCAHATHLVVGGALVRDIGWLALPGLSRLYIDTAWNAIGRRRGVLRYRPDVVVRHHHFSNGLAPFDATYRKRAKDDDRRVFKAWRATFAATERMKEKIPT